MVKTLSIYTIERLIRHEERNKLVEKNEIFKTNRECKNIKMKKTRRPQVCSKKKCAISTVKSTKRLHPKALTEFMTPSEVSKSLIQTKKIILTVKKTAHTILVALSSEFLLSSHIGCNGTCVYVDKDDNITRSTLVLTTRCHPTFCKLHIPPAPFKCTNNMCRMSHAPPSTRSG